MKLSIIVIALVRKGLSCPSLPVAKDLNLCAVMPDHIADNDCSCTKLLGVNNNEKTEAISLVSLKLSIVST